MNYRKLPAPVVIPPPILGMVIDWLAQQLK
jgi:hypothetical protein